MHNYVSSPTSENVRYKTFLGSVATHVA